MHNSNRDYLALNQDIHKYFLTSWMNDANYRFVTSVATTCKSLYRLVQECSFGLFQMSLRDRLCEPWIIEVVKSTYFPLLKNKSIPYPGTDSPLANSIVDRNSLISLFNVSKFHDHYVNMLKDFQSLDKFLKANYNEITNKDISHVERFFYNMSTTQLANSLRFPLLKRLLDLAIAKQNSPCCDDIVGIAEGFFRVSKDDSEYKSFLESIEVYGTLGRSKSDAIKKVVWIIVLCITFVFIGIYISIKCVAVT